MKQVAWIGTGVMGAQQAGHLVQKRLSRPGTTTVHMKKWRRRRRSSALRPCASIADAVSGADVIFGHGRVPDRC